MAARGFVIHFTARSGSTYMIYRLRQHQNITARAEVLGNATLPEGKEQSADNQIAFLRKFWRPYKSDSLIPGELARGLKVQFSRNKPQIQSFSRYLNVLNSYDVAKIFLYRKNRVKQVVSALRAEQVKSLTKVLTGEARAHIFETDVQEKVHELPPIVVHPGRFKKQLRELEVSYKMLDEFKNKVGDCYEITYEEMILNPEKVFNELFELIGVESIPLTVDEPLKKITDDRLENIIKNFDEIQETLRETPYFEQLMER